MLPIHGLSPCHSSLHTVSRPVFQKDEQSCSNAGILQPCKVSKKPHCRLQTPYHVVQRTSPSLTNAYLQPKPVSFYTHHTPYFPCLSSQCLFSQELGTPSSHLFLLKVCPVFLLQLKPISVTDIPLVPRRFGWILLRTPTACVPATFIMVRSAGTTGSFVRANRHTLMGSLNSS